MFQGKVLIDEKKIDRFNYKEEYQKSSLRAIAKQSRKITEK